jgi:hypothetical protein
MKKLPKQEILTFPLETAKADLKTQLRLGRKVISLVPHYEVSTAGTKLAGYMAVVQLSKEERTRVVH